MCVQHRYYAAYQEPGIPGLWGVYQRDPDPSVADYCYGVCDGHPERGTSEQQAREMAAALNVAIGNNPDGTRDEAVA